VIEYKVDMSAWSASREYTSPLFPHYGCMTLTARRAGRYIVDGKEVVAEAGDVIGEWCWLEPIEDEL
jgi:hypothetical protein